MTKKKVIGTVNGKLKSACPTYTPTPTPAPPYPTPSYAPARPTSSQSTFKFVRMKQQWLALSPEVNAIYTNCSSELREVRKVPQTEHDT
jgi:hypothetical protein